MANGVASTMGTASSIETRQLFCATIVSTLSWACDLFDLFIILFVAPTIAKLFFPADNPLLSLASVYGAYAVTVVFRPLGSAIFGPYADRRGRRHAFQPGGSRLPGDRANAILDGSLAELPP